MILPMPSQHRPLGYHDIRRLVMVFSLMRGPSWSAGPAPAKTPTRHQLPGSTGFHSSLR